MIKYPATTRSVWPRRRLIDEVYRDNLPLHIVVTGSAALEMSAGVKETMAGRFERIALRQ